MAGWIGVDLDGTLAEYAGWQGPDHIGAPIPAMIERVKTWLAEGKDVRIFTARVAYEPEVVSEESGEVGDAAFVGGSHHLIREWCKRHIGRALPVTCKKDYGMVELWDDRAVQVIPNTGRRADGR